jgi:pilus assembly protein Flp/PilA
MDRVRELFARGGRKASEIIDRESPSIGLTDFVMSKKELVMSQAISGVRRFLANEDGPTAVEYAVLVGLIVVALITIITNLHSAVSATFSSANSALSSS